MVGLSVGEGTCDSMPSLVSLKAIAASATLLGMEAIYRLNTRDMGIGFVNSVQAAYPDQDIEILVREQADTKPDDSVLDETEYLMSSPANRKRLDEAIKNIEEGKNIISFANLDEAQKCAEEWAARQ